jgi:hypothetical protein
MTQDWKRHGMKLKLKQLLCRLGLHRYVYMGIDSMHVGGGVYRRCEWCGYVVHEMFLQ